jgi:hypothetical protein
MRSFGLLRLSLQESPHCASESQEDKNTKADADSIQESVNHGTIAGWKIGLMDFVSNGNHQGNETSDQIVRWVPVK